MLDLLARATGGRVISLSDKELTAGEILKIHDHPFRTCPNPGCILGTIGMAISCDEGEPFIGLVLCDVCEGAGCIRYTSLS